MTGIDPADDARRAARMNTASEPDSFDEAEALELERRGVRRRPPKIVWVLIVTIVLVGAGAYLALEGGSRVNNYNELKAHGTKVDATVVRCQTSTSCTVKFFIGGKAREETLGGSGLLPGGTATIIVDPQHPSNILPAGEVVNPQSVFSKLEQVFGVILVVLGLALFVLRVLLNLRPVRLTTLEGLGATTSDEEREPDNEDFVALPTIPTDSEPTGGTPET
ncbi:MAG: hypothetical protein ACYDEP_04105 [Acidimicrobiales bacterium]